MKVYVVHWSYPGEAGSGISFVSFDEPGLQYEEDGD